MATHIISMAFLLKVDLFSELIANSREEYVKIAVKLGNDPEL
jgi:hypothetical protein